MGVVARLQIARPHKPLDDRTLACATMDPLIQQPTKLHIRGSVLFDARTQPGHLHSRMAAHFQPARSRRCA